MSKKVFRVNYKIIHEAHHDVKAVNTTDARIAVTGLFPEAIIGDVMQLAIGSLAEYIKVSTHGLLNTSDVSRLTETNIRTMYNQWDKGRTDLIDGYIEKAKSIYKEAF